jgi:hypothetical protein
MNKCTKSPETCLGRDCRDLPIRSNIEICCREELLEEKAVVQNVIDAIDDCSIDQESLLKISSKLSYATHIINTNGDDELIEILPLIKRFSSLLYEFKEKILSEHSISDLACSFTNEIKSWFSYHFLAETYPNQHPVLKQSIIADMNTIEMALGICMIETYDESSLDDLFF